MARAAAVGVQILKAARLLISNRNQRASVVGVAIAQRGHPVHAPANPTSTSKVPNASMSHAKSQLMPAIPLRPPYVSASRDWPGRGEPHTTSCLYLARTRAALLLGALRQNDVRASAYVVPCACGVRASTTSSSTVFCFYKADADACICDQNQDVQGVLTSSSLSGPLSVYQLTRGVCGGAGGHRGSGRHCNRGVICGGDRAILPATTTRAGARPRHGGRRGGRGERRGDGG